MRVAVFGAGYVGLVTGACLADLGHDVVVRDIVGAKIEALRRGELPIHEDGLSELIERSRDRLRFTTEGGVQQPRQSNVQVAASGFQRRNHIASRRVRQAIELLRNFLGLGSPRKGEAVDSGREQDRTLAAQSIQGSSTPDAHWITSRSRVPPTPS